MPFVHNPDAVSCVYWIRHKDHTDIFSQGYVGISENFKRRMRHHLTKTDNPHLANAINKYGWDNLIKEQVVIANKEYCLDVETKLRPITCVGWNIAIGGGNPPKAKKGMGKGRKLSKETIEKRTQSRLGFTHSMETRKKLSELAHIQWAKQKAEAAE